MGCWEVVGRLGWWFVGGFWCDSPSSISRVLARPVMIGGVWRELIWEMYPEAVLADPVDEVTLAEVEKRLQLPLPFELASLLREVDGVADRKSVV